mmetsp:Transcript_84190/g.234786  ORF Transcript_84190/g.234786 Transcript_84190/m.234786 type:complete len:247 (+) Transcript_84190:1284-2024(+)
MSTTTAAQRGSRNAWRGRGASEPGRLSTSGAAGAVATRRPGREGPATLFSKARHRSSRRRTFPWPPLADRHAQTVPWQSRLVVLPLPWPTQRCARPHPWPPRRLARPRPSPSQRSGLPQPWPLRPLARPRFSAQRLQLWPPIRSSRLRDGCAMQRLQCAKQWPPRVAQRVSARRSLAAPAHAQHEPDKWPGAGTPPLSRRGSRPQPTCANTQTPCAPRAGRRPWHTRRRSMKAAPGAPPGTAKTRP